MHAHTLARNISEYGTSVERYMSVKMVEIPDAVRESWLAAMKKKAKLSPLLANIEAMSHTGTLYACLTCTHFVEAQKLILEGNRRYMDKPDGVRLQLREDDAEGRIIQTLGVTATVYSSTLWQDEAAIVALMREDNLDANVAKGETELDSFGHISRIVISLDC